MEISKIIDLTKIPCPQNTSKALIELELMDEGEVLEILLDDGEPIENVPPALIDEGHVILNKTEDSNGVWHLIVRCE